MMIFFLNLLKLIYKNDLIEIIRKLLLLLRNNSWKKYIVNILFHRRKILKNHFVNQQNYYLETKKFKTEIKIMIIMLKTQV
jgi:hypothetical protein